MGSGSQLRLRLRRFKILINRRLYGTSKVHNTSYLMRGSSISKDFILGPFGYVGSGASICPKVEAGKYTMFASNVTITGRDHLVDKPGTPIIFSGRPKHPRTIIGEDVWVATGVIIFAGVKIGNGAIVGAGSVVTSDIAEYDIVGGVPAKTISRRFNAEEKGKHAEMLSKPAKEGFYCRQLDA